MKYEKVVADFAERTQKNLHALEQLHEQGGGVFEVTQLINSMLGLLVFPREAFVSKIPAKPLTELKKEGWPVPKELGSQKASSLYELVRYLRNAIAHFNIEFVGQGDNEIRTIRVWNTRPGRKTKTWEAELGLHDLRAIAERFTQLLIDGSNVTAPDSSRSGKAEAHDGSE